MKKYIVAISIALVLGLTGCNEVVSSVASEKEITKSEVVSESESTEISASSRLPIDIISPFSGVVTSYDEEKSVIEVTNKENESIAFVIDDKTDLVWTHTALGAPFVEYSQGKDVDVYFTEPIESVDAELDACVYGWFKADKVVYNLPEGFTPDPNVAYKPVIYLYPEKETEVSVKLFYDGQLTCTYPTYDNGWNVLAKPDGTLIGENGLEYNYLFWEGEDTRSYDMRQGYCVKGEDTASFLEESLAELGLTRREANEFITFWLPKMQENSYNLISFQAEAYTDGARLEIEPSPDTMIRVFMAWKSLEEEIEIEPQVLNAPERKGFTVVEWGGTEI